MHGKEDIIGPSPEIWEIQDDCEAYLLYCTRQKNDDNTTDHIKR